jgi:hypothetical protein
LSFENEMARLASNFSHPLHHDQSALCQRSGSASWWCPSGNMHNLKSDLR